jgi:hypothetical protein
VHHVQRWCQTLRPISDKTATEPPNFGTPRMETPISPGTFTTPSERYDPGASATRGARSVGSAVGSTWAALWACPTANEQTVLVQTNNGLVRRVTETVECGNGSRTNGMVEQITSTPPRTFRDFARKSAVAWSEAAT